MTRIEVEGDDVEGATEIEPWALAEATSELEPLFSVTNRSHPAIEALLEVCTQRAAATIQAEKEDSSS